MAYIETKAPSPNELNAIMREASALRGKATLRFFRKLGRRLSR